MKKHLLTMTITGLEKEGGFVRFEDFVNESRNLIGIVDRIDREVSGGKSTMYLRIVGLSRKSPPTAVLEACQKIEGEDFREEIVNRTPQLIRRLQEQEEFDEPLDNELIKYLRGFAHPIGTTIESVRIEASQQTSNVTSTLRHQLKRITTPEGTYRGFIRGDLEYINIHDKARKLRVYPNAGPYLDCEFPDALYAKAINAVGKRVEVRGILHYKEAAKFPHAMEVEEIEAFLPEDELPTFEDLRGIAPDMTGDLLSEDFVRQIREAKK